MNNSEDCKLPLYDKNNRLAGTLNLSLILDRVRNALSRNLSTATNSAQLQTTHLTKREKECIRLAMLGNTAKETGKILEISNRTVEYYLENARNKLGCSKRSELLKAVVEAGLL